MEGKSYGFVEERGEGERSDVVETVRLGNWLWLQSRMPTFPHLFILKSSITHCLLQTQNIPPLPSTTLSPTNTLHPILFTHPQTPFTHFYSSTHKYPSPTFIHPPTNTLISLKFLLFIHQHHPPTYYHLTPPTHPLPPNTTTTQHHHYPTPPTHPPTRYLGTEGGSRHLMVPHPHFHHVLPRRQRGVLHWGRWSW